MDNSFIILKYNGFSDPLKDYGPVHMETFPSVFVLFQVMSWLFSIPLRTVNNHKNAGKRFRLCGAYVQAWYFSFSVRFEKVFTLTRLDRLSDRSQFVCSSVHIQIAFDFDLRFDLTHLCGRTLKQIYMKWLAALDNLKVNYLLLKLNRKNQKNISEPRQTGIEPATFWSPVRRSNHFCYQDSDGREPRFTISTMYHERLSHF